MELSEKKVKRIFKFRAEWCHSLGIRVVERDPETQAVLLVECRFCVAFGRESDPRTPRKRKKTQCIKLWSRNYRSDQFKQHMQLNHPVKFTQYQRQSFEGKKNFFNGANNSKIDEQLNLPSLVPKIDTSLVPKMPSVLLGKPLDTAKHGFTYVVGIAGGSGSGKTTLATCLINSIGSENVAYLSHDSYYKDLSHLPLKKRADTNFDHPSSLESELLLEHIKTLKEGKHVEIPLYDFTTHSRKTETKLLVAKPILIVDGILLLTDKSIREIIDLKVFMDTEADVRFIRRMTRDCEERGRTVNSVTTQYLKTVRPMHNQFVEPTKPYADIVVPGGNSLNTVLDLLTVRLQHCLAKPTPEPEEVSDINTVLFNKVLANPSTMATVSEMNNFSNQVTQIQ